MQHTPLVFNPTQQTRNAFETLVQIELDMLKAIMGRKLATRALRDSLRWLRSAEGGAKCIVFSTHIMQEVERLCDRVAIVDAGKVIAIGSPRELMEKSAGKSTIEIECSVSLQGRAIPQWPEATDAKLADNPRRMVVHSTKPARTLVEMIKWVESEGLELEDVHLSRPTLEDVFIELTGKRLRD